jgi:hypothetical protein
MVLIDARADRVHSKRGGPAFSMAYSDFAQRSWAALLKSDMPPPRNRELHPDGSTLALYDENFVFFCYRRFCSETVAPGLTN